jgi:hypothetical protein
MFSARLNPPLFYNIAYTTFNVYIFSFFKRWTYFIGLLSSSSSTAASFFPPVKGVMSSQLFMARTKGIRRIE